MTEEASTATKPARRSRVLKRKTDHSLIERRRRDKINERLIRLQSLVPACRDEAESVLLSKPPPAPKPAAGSDAVSKPAPRRRPKGAWSAEQINERIEADMVLEKLCIISHTFDYVMQLRAELEACKKQLEACDRPHEKSTGLPAPVEASVEAHRAFAHNEDEGAGPSRRTSDTSAAETRSHTPRSTSSQSGDDPDYSDVASPTDLPTCCKKHFQTATVAKRFWGSDNPIPIVVKDTQSSAAAAVTGTVTTPTRVRSAHQPDAVSLENPRAASPAPSSCGSSLAFDDDDIPSDSAHREHPASLAHLLHPVDTASLWTNRGGSNDHHCAKRAKLSSDGATMPWLNLPILRSTPHLQG